MAVDDTTPPVMVDPFAAVVAWSASSFRSRAAKDPLIDTTRASVAPFAPLNLIAPAVSLTATRAGCNAAVLEAVSMAVLRSRKVVADARLTAKLEPSRSSIRISPMLASVFPPVTPSTLTRLSDCRPSAGKDALPVAAEGMWTQLAPPSTVAYRCVPSTAYATFQLLRSITMLVMVLAFGGCIAAATKPPVMPRHQIWPP